jgi:CubicO group peptidase (beta-lactamase class C family)
LITSPRSASMSPTISSIDHSQSEIPDAIVGVMRSVLWIRTKFYIIGLWTGTAGQLKIGPSLSIALRIGVVIVVILFCAAPAPARSAETIADLFPGVEWQQGDAVTDGWSADLLNEAETWSRQIGTTALVVVHHSRIVVQWGDVAAKTQLASVRKSLLSALLGNAIERGDINLKQTLAELGIDDNEPSLSAEEKAATVRDLIEARSGVYHAALYETKSMAAQRPPRGSHAPGTFWYYNNWDFNTLGAIYEHAARHSIFDALANEIARPIGMQDYLPSDGKYVTGAASVYPAYPIDMSARELARFVLLYLHKGKWQDRQVVPAHWVEESTQSYSAAGYGYLWWIGFNNSIAPAVTLPAGTFAALGYGGQYAFAIPAFDLVVVHRAARFQDGGPSMQEFGRLLWLLLDVGRFPDIGPDATIAAAEGTRLSGELKQLLAGKTLRFGDDATGGPYRIRLNSDGSAAALRGIESVQFDAGTWHIEDERLCREWHKTIPLHACWTMVTAASHVGFFDHNGLMVIDARLSD